MTIHNFDLALIKSTINRKNTIKTERNEKNNLKLCSIESSVNMETKQHKKNCRKTIDVKAR